MTVDEVADLFIGALKRAGATIVQSVSHAFPGHGADLRADPAGVARGPAHLAGDRHGEHRHLFVLDQARRAWRPSRSSDGRSAPPPCRSRRSPRADGHAPLPTRAADFVLRGVAGSLGFFASAAPALDRGARRAPAHSRCRRGRRRGCSAPRRCPSRRRWPAAGPTPSRSASGPSSPIRCRGGPALRRRRRRPRPDPRPQHAADRHARTRRRVPGAGSTRFTSMSGPPCSRWRSPATCSRGCASRTTRATRAAVEAAAAHRRGDSSSLTMAFVLLFAVASPLYLESSAVLALAGFIARARRRSLRLGGRRRARRGQRALDAARRLRRHAGVHLHSAHPGLPGRGLRLLRHVAAADRGRPRRRCRSSPRWASSGSSSSPFRMVASPLVLRACLLSVAPRRRWSSAPPRCGGTAAERALGYAVAGAIVGVLFVVLLGRPYTRAITYPPRGAARRSAGSDRAPSCVPGRAVSRAVGRGASSPSAGDASSPDSRRSA